VTRPELTQKKSSLRRLLLVFSSYALLAVVATYPLAFKASDHLFGLGTPPLNVWAIAWVNHQLLRDPLNLFNANAFYPYDRTLAFSEHLFVPALLAGPWLAVTGNPVLAHNAVALLSLALAGFGMFLLCRELTGSDAASYIAGLLYAFHTWNINELIRIQILSNQWFPFFVWSLLRFYRQPSSKWASAAGASYALQSLSCMYWALYLPFVTVPTLIAMQLSRPLRYRHLGKLALCLTAGLALAVLFALPYMKNSWELGFHRESPNPVPIDRYMDVLPGNLLYADWLGTAKPNENAAHFLGFSVLALALLGGLRRASNTGYWRSLRWLFLFFMLSGFLLSLGPEIRIGDRTLMAGPYRLLYDSLRTFRNVRYPERFSILLMLGLSPFVAMGIERLLAPSWKRAGAVGLGAVVFIEHLSIPLHLASQPTGDKIPSVYRAIADRSEIRVIAEVPTTRFLGHRADANAMYFSTVHWKRTVQGFTGYLPPIYEFVRWRLFHFPDDASLRFLQRLGIDAIVVHPEAAARLRRTAPRWYCDGPFPEGHLLLQLGKESPLGFKPSDIASARNLEEQPNLGWRARSNLPDSKHAIDGDLGSFWSTKGPAREHQFIAINFESMIRPARISLMLGDRRHFPMRFEVLGLREDKTWMRLPFDRDKTYDRLFAQLLHRPLETSVDIDLEAPPLWEVLIRVTETDAYELPWEIAEIRIFTERSTAAEADPAPAGS
jgi:hypothetical protein